MPKITRHDGANPPAPRAPEAPKPDYTSLLKQELVGLAEDRGLATDGTKADLVDRLEADDGVANAP